MNIEEAIKTAIEFEMRVRDTYVEALDETKDAVGKRIFKLLSEEEHNHVIYLEATLSQWVARQRLSLDKLDTALPPVEAIQQEIEKLQSSLGDGKGKNELAILKKVYDVEEETSRFYERLVNDLPGEGKEFFSRFLEIEQGHVTLVQAEIDFVNKSGHWFDMAEFKLADY